MRSWRWLPVLAAVAILATLPWAITALAQEPADTDGDPPYGSWEEMEEACHGAGGMMDGSAMGGFHGGFTDPVTLERLAGTLGLTPEELTERLAEGQTIAQVAEAQGVPTSLVVTTILAPQREALQVQVEYGYLTAEQAQSILEQAQQWIEQAITTTGYGAFGHTGGHGGMMGDGYGTGTLDGHGHGSGMGATGGYGGMMGGGMMGGGTMGGGMMGGGTMGGGTMGGW